MKYNYFHKEQKRKFREDPFRVKNLHYDPARDCFYCPMGQPMLSAGEQEQTIATGYVKRIKLYKTVRCTGCSLRGSCHKATGSA